jgi:hypothetical protein
MTNENETTPILVIGVTSQGKSKASLLFAMQVQKTVKIIHF